MLLWLWSEGGFMVNLGYVVDEDHLNNVLSDMGAMTCKENRYFHI